MAEPLALNISDDDLAAFEIKDIFFYALRLMELAVVQLTAQYRRNELDKEDVQEYKRLVMAYAGMVALTKDLENDSGDGTKESNT